MARLVISQLDEYREDLGWSGRYRYHLLGSNPSRSRVKAKLEDRAYTTSEVELAVLPESRKLTEANTIIIVLDARFCTD